MLMPLPPPSDEISVDVTELLDVAEVDEVDEVVAMTGRTAP
jgi:hypothetical protein